MPRKRSPGIYNDVAIQRDVVNAVICSLGPNFWDALSHKGSVPLIDHLFYVKITVYPRVHVNTVHIWFNKYLKYGDVPAALRKSRKRKGYRGSISGLDIQILREIVVDRPYLYLDKISDELYKRTGSIHRYHDSTI